MQKKEEEGFKIQIRITSAVEISNLITSIVKSPRDKTNPPKTIIISNAKDPVVFATITSLPKAAMNLNIPDAIWFMHRSKMYCLNNLQYIDLSSNPNQTYSMKHSFSHLSTHGSNPMT